MMKRSATRALKMMLAARPGLMTASLIGRAGAWSWEPCKAGRLMPTKLWLSYVGFIWRPLYAFARRRGRSPEDAEDLVQGFFEHLISSRGLATVDRSKGKFRSFLLASFQNFISVETRRARAEKRGGRAELIRLDCQDTEAHLGLEDLVTPET